MRALAERARVLRVLREYEAELRVRGVARLRLFGSIARGEAGPESDVDLIAEIDRSKSLSLSSTSSASRTPLRSSRPEGRRRHDVAKMRPRMRLRFEAEAIEIF